MGQCNHGVYCSPWERSDFWADRPYHGLAIHLQAGTELRQLIIASCCLQKPTLCIENAGIGGFVHELQFHILQHVKQVLAVTSSSTNCSAYFLYE